MLGGVGDPGGIINLVRKRPLDHYQLKVEAAAGSWDNYRSQVDVTGPLALDGGLRGRLVVNYGDRQYFMNNRSGENPLVYGVVEADLTPSTMVTLGARVEKRKENGTGDGMPRYTDGQDLGLSRSTWFTTNWAYKDVFSREYFAKFDHTFSNDWKLNVSYTSIYDSSDTLGAFLWGGLDLETLNGPIWGGSYVTSWSEQSVLDVNLSGNFSLLDREHEFLLGMDGQKIDSRWSSSDGMSERWTLPVNPFDPESTPWSYGTINGRYNSDNTPNSQRQYGLYSVVRFQLSDPLKLILGARISRYEFEHKNYQRNRSTDTYYLYSSNEVEEPTKVVPYGGLIYRLNDEWSAYASYSDIYKPQGGKQKGPLPGSYIEPMIGKTYETGVKGELWNGAFNVSAAVFYTQRDNEAISDPAYGRETIGDCCYLERGEVVSKGFDLEISGEVAPGLMLMGGYTYNHNKDKTEGADYSTVTPKHSFKLWSTYTLPGDLYDWKVGTGVAAQSATYVSGTANVYDAAANQNEVPYDFSQGGYAVWDAMVEYQVDRNWSVALNANNLLDRTYYSSVGTAESGNFYGTPRNYMITLRGTFD